MGETTVLAVLAFLVGDGEPTPSLVHQIVGHVGFLAALTVLLTSVTKIEAEQQRYERTHDTLTGALTRSALPERSRELDRRLMKLAIAAAR